MANYSTQIASLVKNYLDNDDWNYSFDAEKGKFDFSLTVSCKLKKIRYRIDILKDEFIVYGFSELGPDPRDPVQLARMAEFVCRANYGLRNGNFELDVRDGEIRYKSFVDCEDTLPGQTVIKNSVICVAGTMKRYSGGIVDLIYSDISPEDAVKQCENN